MNTNQKRISTFLTYEAAGTTHKTHGACSATGCRYCTCFVLNMEIKCHRYDTLTYTLTYVNNATVHIMRITCNANVPSLYFIMSLNLYPVETMYRDYNSKTAIFEVGTSNVRLLGRITLYWAARAEILYHSHHQ